MTTITGGQKVCERDTGLLIRHCECSVCTEIRDEFRELHMAKANVYLSNRDEREKEMRMEAIERAIERYEQWL